MLTMTSTLEQALLEYPDDVAILDDERRYTWSEWIRRISKAAGALRNLGITSGQRYGIVALNSVTQAEAIHAGYWLGAIPVPINFRLAPPEMLHILKDSECTWVLVDPQFSGLLDTEPLKHWREKSVSIDLPEWEQLLAVSSPIPAGPVREEDEALLLYTGGTSGRSKGVPLTHRNIVSNAMQLQRAWPGSQSTAALHVAPMFHAADLVMTPFTVNGGSHCYLPDFTPDLLFSAIEKHGISATLLVPTMIMIALESGAASNYDLSSWQHCVYGTAPMSAGLIQKFMQVFPQVDLVQGYGLTETSPILTFLDFETHRQAIENEEYELLQSCGRPLPGVDLQIVDDNGNEVPEGVAGELLARGPNVFGGYLNLPEENLRAMEDGWFKTGDICRRDETGLYYLMDRKQNLIITGGENVYSSEVENVLNQIPEIGEVAVIGVADERYGETVLAVIVVKPGCTLSTESVKEFCNGKIGKYKVPRLVEFVDELPKSTVGKILKRELREEFSGNNQVIA
jgi:long-chain acyl-CoA synthetase